MSNKFDMNTGCYDLATNAEVHSENHKENVERAIAVVCAANEQQMKKVNAILFS